MRLKLLKTLTVLLLSSNLLTVSTGTTLASTSLDSSERQEITNFNLINDDPQNLEYTYEQDGSYYKIVEQINPSFEEVQSQIYKLNDLGVFELNKEITAVVDEKKEKVSVHSTVNNKTTTESFDLITPTYDINAKASANPPLTGWTFNRTDQYSSNIYKFTVGAIAIAISAYVPASSKVVTGIANLAFQLSVPTLYYKINVYFKFIEGTYLPRAELSFNYIYRDSARTQQIGDTILIETYTPGWGPND